MRTRCCGQMLLNGSKDRFCLLERVELIGGKSPFQQFPLAKALASRTTPKRIVFVKYQLRTAAFGRIQAGLKSIFRSFHASLPWHGRVLVSNGSSNSEDGALSRF